MALRTHDVYVSHVTEKFLPFVRGGLGGVEVRLYLPLPLLTKEGN